MRNRTLLLGLVLVLGACREPDGPLPGVTGQLQVSSDPEGAHIFVDNNDTGFLTPDTVFDIGGSHDVATVLDTAGAEYSYGERVTIQGSEPFVLTGPLTTRCLDGSKACFTRNRQFATAGNMTIAMNAIGSMMLEGGTGQGLLWPAGSGDSYVSNALPLIAGKVGGTSVALGLYDVTSLAGRPAMSIDSSSGVLRTDQRTWVIPFTSSTTLTTIRGIEIREQVLIDPAVPDVALIKLTYRNITNSPAYQKLDPKGTALGTEGVTLDQVYLGFGMDPDIGNAADDAVTYDPASHSVIAYDANFQDSDMLLATTSPGLVGLRMLSAPSGAPFLLNAYGQSQVSTGIPDWQSTTITEALGWGVLSGTGSYAPDDPDPAIGSLVPGPTDVRMVVSAGPYTLRPADELSIVVAVALASPVPGTFTSNVTMSPGDPHDASRPIMATSAALRQKLAAASALLPEIGN